MCQFKAESRRRGKRERERLESSIRGISAKARWHLRFWKTIESVAAVNWRRLASCIYYRNVVIITKRRALCTLGRLLRHVLVFPHPPPPLLFNPSKCTPLLRSFHPTFDLWVKPYWLLPHCGFNGRGLNGFYPFVVF